MAKKAPRTDVHLPLERGQRRDPRLSPKRPSVAKTVGQMREGLDILEEKGIVKKPAPAAKWAIDALRRIGGG